MIKRNLDSDRYQLREIIFREHNNVLIEMAEDIFFIVLTFYLN